MLTVVISQMMEIIYKFNSSLYMSIFYLNIQKGKMFIIHCFTKICFLFILHTSSQKSCKSPRSWISYLSYYISLQIAEIFGDS